MKTNSKYISRSAEKEMVKYILRSNDSELEGQMNHKYITNMRHVSNIGYPEMGIKCKVIVAEKERELKAGPI